MKQTDEVNDRSKLADNYGSIRLNLRWVCDVIEPVVGVEVERRLLPVGSDYSAAGQLDCSLYLAVDDARQVVEEESQDEEAARKEENEKTGRAAPIVAHDVLMGFVDGLHSGRSMPVAATP